MRVRSVIAAAAVGGLLVATVLVAWHRAGDVMAALIAAGWQGIAVVTLVHVGTIAVCALAWRSVALGPGPGFARLLYARWVREAVGNLLGMLPVAGEIVAVRLLTVEGVRAARATACVIADMTAETIGQLAFTLVGLALLFGLHVELATGTALAALPASIPAVFAVAIAVDRRALGLLERAAMATARSCGFVLGAGKPGLSIKVLAILRQRRAVILSILLHLAGWTMGGFEVWLALAFAGHRLPFADALTIEALMWAMRGAAFMLPSGLGVQESSYVLFGALFGVDPGTALALSLIKRARDLLLGIPAIVAWQVSEGGRLRVAPGGDRLARRQT